MGVLKGACYTVVQRVRVYCAQSSVQLILCTLESGQESDKRVNVLLPGGEGGFMSENRTIGL